MPPLALPLLLVLLMAPDKPAYQVVAPADAPLDDISMDELRRVFLLRRLFWKPGHPIRLVLPGNGQPTREFMLARGLRTCVHSFRQRWPHSRASQSRLRYRLRRRSRPTTAR